MTKQQIQDINEAVSSFNVYGEHDQGIFSEPNGIPSRIKEPVIYLRWHTGGVTGGSCWENSRNKTYETSLKEPKFKCLDLVLEELKPKISFLQYREIEDLIHHDDWSEREYYGNCTDWSIKYIILSELEYLLRHMD